MKRTHKLSLTAAVLALAYCGIANADVDEYLRSEWFLQDYWGYLDLNVCPEGGPYELCRYDWYIERAALHEYYSTFNPGGTASDTHLAVAGDLYDAAFAVIS
jgi:hypothetical protein